MRLPPTGLLKENFVCQKLSLFQIKVFCPGKIRTPEYPSPFGLKTAISLSNSAFLIVIAVLKKPTRLNEYLRFSISPSAKEPKDDLNQVLRKHHSLL